jgi:hypothetical protein
LEAHAETETELFCTPGVGCSISGHQVVPENVQHPPGSHGQQQDYLHGWMAQLDGGVCSSDGLSCAKGCSQDRRIGLRNQTPNDRCIREHSRGKTHYLVAPHDL